MRKDFDRFKKHANKFVQSCVDHGRNDLANSVMALINTVERQVDADWTYQPFVGPARKSAIR